MNPFENLQGQALQAALEESAFYKSKELVSRELSTQMITDYATRQGQIAEEESQNEDEIKAFTAPRRQSLKELKAERKSIAKVTKQGFVESEEEVYWMQDFDARQMVAYDTYGNEVMRRRMKPGEMQGMIRDIKSA